MIRRKVRAWWWMGIGAGPLLAQIVYCNVTEVRVQPLLNGVQIVVQADGVLRWDLKGGWGEKATLIHLVFPNARSKLKTHFIDVNEFPVSTIQVSVPQDARQGVGLEMIIRNSVPSFFRINESPDRQSLIVTVLSERTIEREKAPRAGPRRVEAAGLQVEYEDGLLSIRAVRIDIHRLLAEIARLTGAQIVVDDAVHNQASMSIERQPVDKVLQSIASAYGLALSRRGEVYLFSTGVPQDLAAYNLSGTESFRLRYIRADTAAGLLPTFLFKYLLVNSEQNAIVVTAPSQMLDKIRSDLQKIDLAPPQILVEALAVELTHSAQEMRSLDFLRTTTRWEAKWNTGTGALSYRVVPPLSRDFVATLQALAQEGKAHIRAHPRMAVVNGETADIFIGSQRFIKVLFLQFGLQQERIQAVDVGVKLQIRPWTGGNGEITSRIEAEVSNIVEIDPRSGLPVLSTRRAETSVRVRDGETIVIGGLILGQEFSTTRKIPLLSEIPLLGNLWRGRDRSRVESELYIFVTPRLLTETGHLPDPQEERNLFQRFLGQDGGG